MTASYINFIILMERVCQMSCKNLKKLRFIGLVFCVLLIVGTSHAQSIEWSNARKVKGNAVFTRVLGENVNGVYVLRYRNRFFTRNIIIEKYRSHLGYNFSRNILLKKSRLIAVDLTQESLVFFTSEYNKVERKNELRAQFYDQNILPKSKEKILASITPSEPYDKGDFRVQSSSDLSKYLVFYTSRSPDDRKEIYFKVFDEQLALLKEQKVILPLSFDEYNLIEYIIDNEGNVAFILREKKKISKRAFEETPKFRLFVWQFKQDKLNDLLLADSSTYIQQLRLSIDRTYKTINVTGYYSNNFQDRFSGIYLCKVHVQAMNSAKQYFTAMPFDLMSQLIGERQAKEKFEAYDFKQLKAIPMSNGSIVTISERSSMSSEEDIIYVNGVPQNTSRNIYNFDDVLITCLDSSGKLIWHQVLNKNQSSLNDGGYYSSIVMGITPEGLHIIFNDKMRGNGNVLQYSITADGKMSNKILLRSEREYIAVIPSESLQISSNKLMIPVSKDKKFAILKLVY